MATSSPPEERKSLVSVMDSYGIKPISMNNVLFYYFPAVGVGNYTLLSINVMNPGMVVRFFPKRDLTNFLLLSSLVGTGLYIYNRPHLSAAPMKLRIVYSTYGTFMFSFGSVLLWAVLRSILPENWAVGTLAGIASGVTVVCVGKNYLEYVDSQLGIDASE